LQYFLIKPQVAFESGFDSSSKIPPTGELMKNFFLTLILFTFIGCGNSSQEDNTDKNIQGKDLLPSKVNPNKQNSKKTEKDKKKKDKKKKIIKNPILFCDDGQCKNIEKEKATEKNYFFIDFGDNWVPYLFTEQSSPGETKQKNNYRSTFLALAQNRTTEDSKKLKKGQNNYLELYGIPPTLSVLQKRFLNDAQKKCSRELDWDLFTRLKNKMTYSRSHPRKYFFRFRHARKKYLRWARRKGIKKTLEHAKEAENSKKKLPSRLRIFIRAKNRLAAVNEMRKRFICEGIVKANYLRKNYFDLNMRRAIRKFEKKHKIYNWGHLTKKIWKKLSNSLLENNFQSLKRVISTRVAHSLAIFEDGTTKVQTKDGIKKGPDLIGKYTKLVMQDLGIDTPQKALSWFQSYSPEYFNNLKIAFKLPALPEYYSDNMEFYIKISVGDVWYDVPYTPDGKRKYAPRGMLPHLYLYTVYKGRKIMLSSTGTTAGGWKKEYKDKQIFMKYKSSDLGPKEWKYIVAAPVWFPPKSTPPSDLTTKANIKGRYRTVVKWKTLGPSYASAYGLVMAPHTTTITRNGKEEDLDRGIRTHGSVNYMSIKVGFSHGCHRLYNHLALRIFSNILKHRQHSRIGQKKADWTHFVPGDNGKTLRIHQKTKGYYYQLEPPVKILVTRRYIVGKVKQPIKELIRIPDKKYPEESDLGMQIGESGELLPIETTDSTPVEDGTALKNQASVKDASSLATSGKTVNKKVEKKDKKPKKDKNKKLKQKNKKKISIKNKTKKPKTPKPGTN
jgi:hypothetical protein